MDHMQICRSEEPTKNDTAQQYTICKVCNGDFFDIYVQLSKDEEHPNWLFIGTFLMSTPDSVVNKEIEERLGI